MNHRFYQKSKKQRTYLQGKIALAALVVTAASAGLAWVSQCYFLGIFVLAVVLSVVAPFFDTPSLKNRGKLVYYSPLFLVEEEKDGVLEVHGGTLFDYCFVIDKAMNGRQRTIFIIQQYLQGLLNLIEKYEKENQTNLTVRGTSYIISERTARKAGFKVVKTDYLKKLLLIYNFVNLSIANSIAKNKISFPNLNNSQTYEADLTELKDRKNSISQMNDRLTKMIDHFVSPSF